jgi:hypothetical protein
VTKIFTYTQILLKTTLAGTLMKNGGRKSMLSNALRHLTIDKSAGTNYLFASMCIKLKKRHCI